MRLPPLRIKEVIEVTKDSHTLWYGVVDYMQPMWSPDGKKLALTRDDFKGLYVKNAVGTSAVKLLTSADHSGFEPLRTSDSKAIVLRSRKSIVSKSITCIDVKTGEVEVIAEKAIHPRRPQINTRGDVVIEIESERKVLDQATGRLRTMEKYCSEEILRDEVRIEMDFRNNRLWIIQGNKKSLFPTSAMLHGYRLQRIGWYFME